MYYTQFELLAYILDLNPYFFERIPEKYRLPIYYFKNITLKNTKFTHRTYYICKFIESYPELSIEQVNIFIHLISDSSSEYLKKYFGPKAKFKFIDKKWVEL